MKQGQHTYVSAVAVNISTVNYLDDDMSEERPMPVRVLHNPFADCAFPKEIFPHKDDEHYASKWAALGTTPLI